MENEKTPVHDEVVLVAIAHLSMIAQAARGEYKPQPDEINRRQAWLMSFFRTGVGLVTDQDRAMAGVVNQALTQPPILSTQPEDDQLKAVI